ncbi:MAG: DUF354 domain-containing protein [Pyrinomonadaceae bacterium]
MRIWIDLANSPHVPFFRALIPEFVERGHSVEITARAFAQTVEMAEAAGLEATVIGAHGGGKLGKKAGNLVGRAMALARWACGGRSVGSRFDLAVSHNSYAQIAAARSLGIKSVTLMDYEHQPANHLAFRLATTIVVPRVFPESALLRAGARAAKVRRYNGIKEDVYLADFVPDPQFMQELNRLGVESRDVLVVLRPPAREALYHRFDNELFDECIARLRPRSDVKMILLARSAMQREKYAAQASANLILPTTALDGANLIAAADLVVSAGGTMNREAAALGIPVATIYAGRWAAVDEQLVREDRLRRIHSRADLEALPVRKKPDACARRVVGVRKQVTELILAP